MKVNGVELVKINEYCWEIPKSGGMLVPGRIYATSEMLANEISADNSLSQVFNVAHLPGIQKYSIAMPDIHVGYGFPIGGVAATDAESGAISPGGVGYDINCGVRLASTQLMYEDVKSKITDLTNTLFKKVPTGVGAKGAIEKATKKELKEIMIKGAGWAVENGYGSERDLSFIEEGGRLKGADPDAVEERAIERGLEQVGTLGSGNHFLEVDVIEEVYDEKAAAVFGLAKGGVAVLLHTGSRGFGYQICDDYLKIILRASEKFGYNLPDKQLACAPLNSKEGREYFGAMQAAANFAWCNRQVIMELAKRSFMQSLGISEGMLGFKLVYDVSHNIAKIENHLIDGKFKKVCVHRKGATRAFPAGSGDIPAEYKESGQPVIIPGDMGRYSYVLAGLQGSMEETFGSSCHGAGRLMSRSKALKSVHAENVLSNMKAKGIAIQAKGIKTLAEEMPEAYKDVSKVVDVMHNSGVSKKVAKLRPIGVIKG
jgi:tRNA-splicing ligase RtcB